MLYWAAVAFVLGAIAYLVKLPKPFWWWPLVIAGALVVLFFLSWLWGKIPRGDPS